MIIRQRLYVRRTIRCNDGKQVITQVDMGAMDYCLGVA